MNEQEMTALLSSLVSRLSYRSKLAVDSDDAEGSGAPSLPLRARITNSATIGPRRRTRPLPKPQVVRVKRSYWYRWNNLDHASFRAVGVIARRAPDGTPRFNFPQTIWVYPRAEMNWAPHMNRQVETLAVNILAAFVLTQARRNRIRATNRFTLDESTAFAKLFLCTMPRNGGCIPRTVIQEWIRRAL
jgi:hypothetical protein